MEAPKAVLRMQQAAGMSNRRTAASCGIGRPTVREHLQRAKAAGLGWPLPSGA